MVVDAGQARKIITEADLLVSADEVQRAIERMALEIGAHMGDQIPVAICVMNGGLVFAGQILPLLDFPLELDYVHATRYGKGTRGDSLEWKAMPKTDLRNRVVLLLDDILDEGVTLDAIACYCREQGAKEVLLAVLVEKLHLRKIRPGMKADFTGIEVGDRFLFGYGLDCMGIWRNARGIYAVRNI